MKRYVAVEARFDEGGGMRPLCVVWEDGRRFSVDRVMEVRRAASLKAGGTGLRYRCLIGGRERYLFLKIRAGLLKWDNDAFKDVTA